MIKARWRGMPEAKRAFDDLIGKIEREGTRRALNKAATPIVAEARRRVPVDEGLTKKSLGKRVSTALVRKVARVRIGVRRRMKGKRARIVHLLEFGTERSDPKPFLRPAWRAKRDEAKRIFRENLAADISKAARSRIKRRMRRR